MTASRAVVAEAFPATRAAMLAIRKVKTKRTIIDLVEDIYLTLLEGESRDTFLDHLTALSNSEAVTGSTKLDDFIATQMVHKKAVDDGITDVVNAKLESVRRALLYVSNRYGLSRRQLREERHAA